MRTKYRTSVLVLPQAQAQRQITDFLRYQTGRPFTGANTLSKVFQSTVQCNGCSPDEGRVFTNAAGFVQFFDDTTRGKFSMTPAGKTGNTVRTSASLGTFTGPSELIGARNIQLGAEFSF